MAVELRPLGVTCNIRCRYCYQNPQREAGNYRQPYDLEKMRAAVEREGGPFTLFGGEPLLLPLSELEELFRWGFEKYGRNGIQTNGLLISAAHLELFRRYNVDVGISIDGPEDLNDLRWDTTLERTRRATVQIEANIARVCREHRPPGLIVTLHRLNATAERLPRMHAWMRELDALGIRSVRLHALEVDSPGMRAYSLTDEENVRAFLGFAELQPELKTLRFDVIGEIERGLLGNDAQTSCVWRSCDPWTTEAVRGVEGNGQSSNCGRTNKDGVDFLKADAPGYERYLALQQTPQDEGGCKGCRFFLMCRGQCPGTAIGGDWRNRSELCGLWKGLFIHVERNLILTDRVPLTIQPVRQRMEQHLALHWAAGRNTPTHKLPHTEPAARGETFPLPRFLRRAFAGEAQRAVWQPRLDAVLRLVPASGAVPACCQAAGTALRDSGRIDPVWAACGAASDVAELRLAPATNFLLRPMGIDLLGYAPCAFDCEESRARGEALLAAARGQDAEAAEWLEEILGWPMEWSALHGIAEVKTPVLKIAYATDYTATRRVLRLRGVAPPAGAARGVSFPYREVGQ